MSEFEDSLRSAFNELEAVLGGYYNGRGNAGYAMPTAQFYSLYRQHLVNSMAQLEQSGIDSVISAGVEAMDRKAEQEGIS